MTPDTGTFILAFILGVFVAFIVAVVGREIARSRDECHREILRAIEASRRNSAV